ncbi:hypothetical protein GALMADRAFT_231185 [Galerina marginata CBS 339.88]|uniref:Uncharacterized protein n=1 Tax=Galerina marginata (strain CBS 339.88) TaxID=685588 RepID=A0A067SLG5_GALM3|nr:hypothetical protein GALMADRAFT_231185 [Galerina marginata CBS 339.88]
MDARSSLNGPNSSDLEPAFHLGCPTVRPVLDPSFGQYRTLYFHSLFRRYRKQSLAIIVLVLMTHLIPYTPPSPDACFQYQLIV